MTDLTPSSSNGSLLVEEATVRALADTISSCIEYAQDRQKWMARLAELDRAYAKHDRSEERELAKRRMETELTRFTIQILLDRGNAAEALEAFSKYMDATPDILGKAVKLILNFEVKS